jgi:hypothetical protein
MARGKKVSNKQKASAARKKLQAAFEAAAAAAETKKHATKRKKSPDNITSEVEAAEDTNAKRIRRSDFSSMTPPSSDSNPSRKGKKTRAKNSDAIIDASLLEDLSAEDSKVDAEGHMDIDGKDGNADDEHVLDTTSEGAGDVSGGAGELDGVAGDAEAVTHASKSSKKSRMARNFFAPVVAGMQQATQLFFRQWRHHYLAQTPRSTLRFSRGWAFRWVQLTQRTRIRMKMKTVEMMAKKTAVTTRRI